MTLLSWYSFAAHWAFQPWMVVLLVLVAGAMVVYLYRVQQQIASRRVVVTLTALRLMLVALMFVLLAGLSVQWRRTGSSGGTLWLVVDTSASMAQADPRATAVEKLRWADVLGLLPVDLRASKLDRRVAELAALRADLAHRRATAELDAKTWGAELRAWADRVRAAADELGKDPEVRKTPGEVVAGVRDVAKRADDAAGKAARDVPWKEMEGALDAAANTLRPMADAADQRLLAEKGSDAKVVEALDKVGKMTRAQLAQAVLTEKPKLGGEGIIDLVPRQTTKVVTFADAPEPVAVGPARDLPAALKAAAGKPDGQSTNLAAALRHVYDQLGQDEPASVVVVSDGRHNMGGDLIEPARLLASRGVRVFTVAMGSTQRAADAAVEQIDAPDWVYHDDTVRASALLRLDGLVGKPVNVELWRGDTKVEGKTVTPTQEHATQVVSFVDKPPAAGVFEYDVRIGEVADEAVKENNRLGARVAVKKDKLAVLVVEDMPRWEYRHLVNYLSRDQRVKLQTVLLQPARVMNVQRPASVRASPRNEGVEAQLLPGAAQEWAAFDLVVLGDVPKEALSDADQQNLAAAVKDRGTTLLLMAGPFHMPQRYAGTALEGLVPVELGGEWSGEALEGHLKNGFVPRVAPEGAASILSQFTIDEASNGALWGALPKWYWHSALTTAKRSASVVWTIGESGADGESEDGARSRALLATMSVGMGRVMYLASDSTWRMRQVGGQNPHERFWGQVVRWVVDNELPAGAKWVRYGSDKARYVAGENVVVTARLLGEDFSPLRAQKIRAVAKSGGSVLAQAEMVELPEAPGYYRATLGGVPAGKIELSLQGDAAERLMAKDPAAPGTLVVDVQSKLSVEQRNVNADRAAMVRVAEAGAGVGVEGPYADLLGAHVPPLNYVTETTEQVGLFTHPDGRYARLSHWAFLAMFAAIASAEWIVRKAAGLV